jgi:hypothetical protein
MPYCEWGFGARVGSGHDVQVEAAEPTGFNLNQGLVTPDYWNGNHLGFNTLVTKVSRGKHGIH